jgi:uncharacterized paraquat-inducible protein A
MAASCAECRESLAEDADRCPNCGYHPHAELRNKAKWNAIIGTVLSITVIGLVIGVPMVLYAWYLLYKAHNATPAA